MKIEMNFLPDIYVPCEVCKGARYNRETLEVKYNGKTIADVLDMTVEDAYSFFEAIPTIERKMQLLCDVGLGYMKIGQPSTTLSGGEAQRIKLAAELSKRATGKTIYILDEPTTGLHFEDVRKLMEVLERLVEGGNTLIIIEHNLDVMKCADWIVDLGPEGGVRGGRIVATGTPEQLAAHPTSYTGEFLKRVPGIVPDVRPLVNLQPDPMPEDERPGMNPEGFTDAGELEATGAVKKAKPAKAKSPRKSKKVVEALDDLELENAALDNADLDSEDAELLEEAPRKRTA